MSLKNKYKQISSSMARGEIDVGELFKEDWDMAIKAVEQWQDSWDMNLIGKHTVVEGEEVYSKVWTKAHCLESG